MSTLAEIEAAADALPAEQAEQLLQHLVQRLARQPKPAGDRIANLHPGAFQPTADFDALLVEPQPRVAGLHAGAWVLAPDFDDPLPEEFWLGKDR